MHCFNSISTNWMKSFEKIKIFYQNKFKYSKMRIVFNYIMLTISTFVHKTIYMHLFFIKTDSLSRSNSDFMFWCALCGFFWLDTMSLLKRALNRTYQAKFNEKMQPNTSIFFQNKDFDQRKHQTQLSFSFLEKRNFFEACQRKHEFHFEWNCIWWFVIVIIVFIVFQFFNFNQFKIIDKIWCFIT